MQESVILVDPSNRTIGYGEKYDIHRRGIRHRAFSVFLVDDEGRTLLQRRYEGKYHSGGLWANSCCGHPRPKESIRRAAERRLNEELGVLAPLKPCFTTAYSAQLDNGMSENEIVTIFVGRFTGELNLNPLEATDTALVPLDALYTYVEDDPSRYSVWLRHYLRNHYAQLDNAHKWYRDPRLSLGLAANM